MDSFVFENRPGANSANLKRKRLMRFNEINIAELNKPDISYLKLDTKTACKPPLGMQGRRYSLGRVRRVSLCQRAQSRDVSQENLKENLLFVKKYELPNKKPLAMRKVALTTGRRVFAGTQTD